MGTGIERLLGGKPDVGCDHGVRRAQDGQARVEGRLGVKYVQAGACDAALLKCRYQCLGIHDRTTGGVDEDGVRLHAGDLTGSDHVEGVGYGGHVHAEHVAAGAQLVKR